ncbi:MAG: hypothetical protein MUF63_01085 [Rhodobacteraceae bacterium]|nr:hypothetical protein [Paracoccaceae bacterium]
MSEDKRLRDKLAKLADEEAGAGERRLGGDLVEAMLEEIDEAILGRTLTFRGEDGAVLALQAANRRLLCVTAVPEGLAVERAMVLAPLGPEDEAALAAVAGALKAFAAGRREVVVTALPFDQPLDPGMRGRSAAAVAKVLGITLYDRPAPVAMPDPAQGFDAGFARLALAVAAVSGEDTSPATGPDADAVGRLSRFGTDGIAAILREVEAGSFVVLAGGTQAVFAGRKPNGRAVVALLPAERAQAAVALWRATGGA